MQLYGIVMTADSLMGIPAVSITVKGTTYPNTIVTEERVEQFAANTWTDISSFVGFFRTYYSRNIGMIKKEYVGTTNQTESVLELRRHQVF